MVSFCISDILQRLEILQENLQCKYPLDTSDSNIQNVSLVLVRKAVEKLSEFHCKRRLSIEETELAQVFLRRLQRTLPTGERLCKHVPQWDRMTSYENLQQMDIYRLLRVELWQPYKYDCQWILQSSTPHANAQIWITIQRVKQFEDALNQRKLDYESKYGQPRSFGELYEENRVCLVEYLKKCVSLHSTVPVRGVGMGKNVDQFFTQMFGTLLTSECKISAQEFLNKIEMPLRLSASRVREVKIWLSLISKTSTGGFIPSVKEAEVNDTSTMSREETILSVLQNTRWSVILSDPGCGKTSLLRWVMLQFAQFLLQGKTFPITVEGVDEWEQLAAYSCLNNLFVGHARVPILIRISELATWLDSHPFSTIIDYIGSQTWFGNAYSERKETKSVLRQFVFRGHALVLFDGFDEVSDYTQRGKIANLIELFLKKYVHSPEYISLNDDKDIIQEWGEVNCPYTAIGGGNQVIITSRVVGYHLFPIRGSMLKLFHLQPMDQSEMESLLDHCVINVYDNIVRCANLLNIAPLDAEKVVVIRKQKDTRVRAMLYRVSEKIWSHPMLFSLIFPILYRMTDDIEFTTRVALYEATVRSVLNMWTMLQSTWSNETVEWVLRDIANHIHQNCPSGLIDTFDLTRLILISVKAFYKHKNITTFSTELLLARSKELIDLFKLNNGFVAARGLEAYGFVHLTFQEYFVALAIVKPLSDETKLFPSVLIDQLSALITKPNFFEPLSLSIECLQSMWSNDKFDAFCTALIKKYIGTLPIGALLLVSILGEFFTPPSRHFLYQLFDCLLSGSLDVLILESLRRGLSAVPHVCSLIEDLTYRTTNRQALCRLLLHCLDYEEHNHWNLPTWLPEKAYITLESLSDNNQTTATMVDFALRSQIDTNTNIFNVSSSNNLSMFLIERKIVASDIHPVVLSVIIALCGGLYCQSIDEERVSRVQFDASRMHRVTPISNLLLTYFTYDFSEPIRGVQYLIQKCKEIIHAASTADVSRKVIDAFMAVICLQGVSETLVYDNMRNYTALSCALYRFKLVLYHLRHLYVAREFQYNFSFPWDDAPDFLEKLAIDLRLSLQSMDEITEAIVISLNRLTHYNFQNKPMPLITNRNAGTMRSFEPYPFELRRQTVIHSSNNIEEDPKKWPRVQVPYQLFHGHEVFPVEFVSPHLRPLFERFVSTKRLVHGMEINTHERLNVVILLSELLLRVHSRLITEASLESLRLLLDIDNDIREQNLESYCVALIQIAKRNAKLDMKHISQHLRDFVLAQTEDKVQMAVEKERQRIFLTFSRSDQPQSDLQLYVASIALARLCELISSRQIELFDEAKRAGYAIQNRILRALCLCHLREIVRLWVDTSLYHIIQTEIIETVEQLPENLSLLIAALILAYSYAEGEHSHSSLSKLSICVWSQLNSIAKNGDEARDQDAAYQAVIDVFGGQIPQSFLHRAQSSDIFHLHSSVFSRYFQNKVSLDHSNSVLLSQMYLTELTVDTQILARFTSHPVALKTTLHTKERLERLWERFDKPSSWSPIHILSHGEAIFINRFLQSESNKTIHIPFEEHLPDCTGFEDRDRSVIESWLRYYDDKHRCQFSIFAVLLLLRCGKQISPIVLRTIEIVLDKALNSQLDRIRQGARVCLLQSSQMRFLAWKPSLLGPLAKVHLDTSSEKLVRFTITSVADVDQILELEHHRIIVQGACNKYVHPSYLSLIGQCSDQIVSHFPTRLSDLSTIENSVNDTHLANFLFYLIRKLKKDQWNEHSYELITSLLYNSRLPYTQLAAVYTLKLQERGRDILCNVLLCHYHNESSTEGTSGTKLLVLDNDVFVACLWAVTRSKIDTHRSQHQQLQNYLYEVWCKSDSAAACFLSYTLREEECFEKLQARLSINVHYLYKLFVINTSYVIDWYEREDWIKIVVKLLEKYWSELSQGFIVDFYTYLCADSRTTVTYWKPCPDFCKIAKMFVGEQPFLLYQGMSEYGEQEFQHSLYNFSKRCLPAQRIVCLEIYSLFGAVTVEFLDMAFTACLDDFTLLQHTALNCFDRIRKADDREVIEIVFVYLKSPSMFQRYLAAKCLVKLTRLGFLSTTEVYKLLSDVLNDPASTEVLAMYRETRGKSLDAYIRSLLLSMTCLEQIDEDRTSLPALTSEEIHADFTASLEAPCDSSLAYG